MQTHMPLGYKMIDGKIEIDKEKAKVVKRIFKDYQSGKSLLKIADTLKEEQVKNANSKTNWTHGAVGRILENVKYMGDHFYPSLIKKELFEKVQEMRKSKEKKLGRTAQLNSMKNSSIFLDKIICGECKEPYRKYVEHSGKSYEKVRWKCKKYIYKNRVLCTNLFYTDEQIKEIIVNAINQLIKNPKLISSNPPPKILQKNLELAEVENRISELKENDEMSSAELVKLIYKRAEVVYNSTKINDYDLRTQTIKEVLENQNPLLEFNEEVFQEIIKEIHIYQDGTVTTKFINGVTISEIIETGKGGKNGCKQKDGGNNTATDEV